MVIALPGIGYTPDIPCIENMQFFSGKIIDVDLYVIPGFVRQTNIASMRTPIDAILRIGPIRGVQTDIGIGVIPPGTWPRAMQLIIIICNYSGS